ncbi:MAG: hypothetical protein VW907_05455 [Opitutae bacterium]
MATIIIDSNSSQADRDAWDATRAANLQADLDAARIPNIDAAARLEIFKEFAPGVTEALRIVFKEINQVARAVQLLRRESAGTATSEEITELDALEAKLDKVTAIIAESKRLEADPSLTKDDAVWP